MWLSIIFIMRLSQQIISIIMKNIDLSFLLLRIVLIWNKLWRSVIVWNMEIMWSLSFWRLILSSFFAGAQEYRIFGRDHFPHSYEALRKSRGGLIFGSIPVHASIILYHWPDYLCWWWTDCQRPVKRGNNLMPYRCLVVLLYASWIVFEPSQSSRLYVIFPTFIFKKLHGLY